MDKLSGIPSDAYAAAQTYAMCKKCIATVFISLGGLYYLGALTGVSVQNPISFVKPAGILIGASIATEFLFTESGKFGYPIS